MKRAIHLIPILAAAPSSPFSAFGPGRGSRDRGSPRTTAVPAPAEPPPDVDVPPAGPHARAQVALRAARPGQAGPGDRERGEPSRREAAFQSAKEEQAAACSLEAQETCSRQKEALSQRLEAAYNQNGGRDRRDPRHCWPKRLGQMGELFGAVRLMANEAKRQRVRVAHQRPAGPAQGAPRPPRSQQGAALHARTWSACGSSCSAR